MFISLKVLGLWGRDSPPPPPVIILLKQIGVILEEGTTALLSLDKDPN